MRNMTRPVRDGITQRNIRRCCRYLGSLLVCFLILAALFAFSGCELGRGGEVTVPVMLADAEGLRVLSENPAYVPIGEKASFRIVTPKRQNRLHFYVYLMIGFTNTTERDS